MHCGLMHAAVPTNCDSAMEGKSGELTESTFPSVASKRSKIEMINAVALRIAATLEVPPGCRMSGCHQHSHRARTRRSLSVAPCPLLLTPTELRNSHLLYSKVI